MSKSSPLGRYGEAGAFLLLSLLLLSSCSQSKFKHDASGTFEATEIIVSSETQGKIQELNLQEGDFLTKNQYVGFIDTTQVYLQKLQLISARRGVESNKPNVSVQLSALKEQLAKAEKELARVQRLYADETATQQQLDDAQTQVEVMRRNLKAQEETLRNSVGSLNEQSSVYEIQIAQADDLLKKSYIRNPIDGVVLTKYAEAKEVVGAGMPLYKVADTRNLFLRAYVVSGQLEKIKVGQSVKVSIALSDGNSKTYDGKIAWISDKAEFTPKTIQTKDERQNLVYAVKIAVENTDGLIKIGMYGDVEI